MRLLRRERAHRRSVGRRPRFLRPAEPAHAAGALGQLDVWWIHFQQGFASGIVNVKDIVYYLALTYFFLLLTVKTLEAKRWQ